MTLEVTPTAGPSGWLRGPATVSVSASDDSAVAETNCTVDGAAVAVTGGAFTIGKDGVHDVTCTATDDAGQTSAPAATTVKIDSSPPVIAYSGNAGTYSVDATVNIACDASDALSGIAATTCTAITGPAYGFATGQNTFSSSTDDVAGNHTTASTSFVVLVTAAGLSALTINFVQDSAAYKALDPMRQAALDRQASALSGGLSSLAPGLRPAQRAALIRAYQVRVAAAAGRGLLTSGQAATLQRLAIFDHPYNGGSARLRTASGTHAAARRSSIYGVCGPGCQCCPGGPAEECFVQDLSSTPATARQRGLSRVASS